MAEVAWYRCPGLVSDKRSDRIGKPLDGCWLALGLDVERKGKGGNIYCAHCGDTMMGPGRDAALSETPVGVSGLSVWLKRIDLDDVVIRGYQIACCYNQECSQRYLPDDARGSDAERDNKRIHSGTQYIWKLDTTVKDTWAFGEDVNEDGGEPRNEPDGKSWRRCVFCGSLMKMQPKPSKARMIYKNLSERDTGWEWGGPAATFRVYRKEEYEAFAVKRKTADKEEVRT